MKFKQLFIAAMLCCPTITFAQSNFQPGYIITSQKDSVSGLIDYREWLNNPKLITFKNNGSAAEKRYSAEDLKGFGILGKEKYESYLVKISQNAVSTNNPEVGLDTSTVTNKVFLRVVTSGVNLELFDYTDKIKERYYIKRQADDIPLELIYRNYINAEDNKVVTSTLYRNQLTALAAAFNENSLVLQKLIGNASYAESDLAKIVDHINHVNANEVSKKEGRIGVQYNAQLAANVSSLTYKGDFALANTSASTSVFPKIGLGIDILPNKYTRRLILRAELSYTRAKFLNESRQYSYAFTANTFSVTPQLIFNIYNSSKLKFYGGAGAVLNYNSYQKDLRNYYNDTDYAQSTSTPFENVVITGTFNSGITINNRFEIFGYYNLPANVISTLAYSAHIVSYGGGVRYLFAN